jgi:hydrogenase expression/formation protein HypE
MEDDRISLAHGNGGRFMRELIEEVFARHLGEANLDVLADAAPIALNGGDVMITTDGFTVQPLEFPGGDIGSLAVHGTTNDLAVAGARPMYLTLNAFMADCTSQQQVLVYGCLAYSRPYIASRTAMWRSLVAQLVTTVQP